MQVREGSDLREVNGIMSAWVDRLMADAANPTNPTEFSYSPAY